MTTTTSFPAATVLGYPRIGANRELKRAIEAFWSGGDNNPAETAAQLRAARTQRLQELGLDSPAAVPEDFSYYDQVLDITLAAGALPERFAPEREVLRAAQDPEGAEALRAQFTVARGEGDRPALELTKWFDSNYHYLVPEIGPGTEFEYLGSPRVAGLRELGAVARPVLVGPVTYLALAKAADSAPEGFNPLERLDDLLGFYEQLLAELKDAGATWVQFDEPALVTDRHRTPQDRGALLEAVSRAYGRLASGTDLQLAVALTYGQAFDAVDVLAQTPVQAVIVDLVRGAQPDAQQWRRWGAAFAGRTLGLGVVSGRNIWRTDFDAALAVVRTATAELGENVQVSITTSTSLQHVPHDVEREVDLDPQIRRWLAFADQKATEVATLAVGAREGDAAIAQELEDNRAALASRRDHGGVDKPEIRTATAAVTAKQRTRGDYQERRRAQAEALQLPLLPTTTIGSFPQTAQIRNARAAHRRGELSDADYTQAMRAEIEQVIRQQEDLGLDVLVHGEAERNDMVQYFAELLDGCATTTHGWVQSYGSRCTRPSILWGDISRPAPMTVEWSAYAQSLTDKPVKGMLTGPVTIMAWSFVREDVPAQEVADQLGLALREEVKDLTEAGISIIQVDEPAIRELLPLREADRAAYLEWSVGAFRLATSGAGPETSIHTHLCYSDFATIVDAVDSLDADVTSIEASRSRLKVLPALAEHGFARGLGPGVWDIHSARVPSTAEIRELIEVAVGALDPRQVCVNPDCGLKTRRWEETAQTLRHLVEAAEQVRAQLS